MTPWPPGNCGVSNVRASECEHLDDPGCDPALAVASYRFMTLINTFTGGTAVVRRFLAARAREREPGTTLRVLDIGSGSCDIPVTISRWAKRRGMKMQFTCLETSQRAIELAKARLGGEDDAELHVFQEDVFTHQPSEPYDVATASMCFHHFSDVQIQDLLQKLRSIVRGGVLINDLRRTPAALIGAWLLTVGTHAGLRHDAMLSVRRGFTVCELTTLLQQIPDLTVRVKAAWCFRVAAEVEYNGATEKRKKARAAL